MYKTYYFNQRNLLTSILNDFPDAQSVEFIKEIYLLDRHIQSGTLVSLHPFSPIYFGEKIVIPDIDKKRTEIFPKYGNKTKQYYSDVKEIIVVHKKDLKDLSLIGMEKINYKLLTQNINILMPIEPPKELKENHIISGVSIGELSLNL